MQKQQVFFKALNKAKFNQLNLISKFHSEINSWHSNGPAGRYQLTARPLETK